MGVEGLLAWVPQRRIDGMRWPIVRFVLIAAMTATQQIVQVIGPALSLGTKMIDSQFSACIRFADSTKLTGEVRPLTYLEPYCFGDAHAGWTVGVCANWRCNAAMSRRSTSFWATSSWMRWVTVSSCATAVSTCTWRVTSVCGGVVRASVAFS